jgi:hypothetical protein
VRKIHIIFSGTLLCLILSFLLDPRSSSDSRVKRSVQYDAWVVATHRMGLSTEHMKKFCPPNYSGFSLEKLN